MISALACIPKPSDKLPPDLYIFVISLFSTPLNTIDPVVDADVNVPVIVSPAFFT
nr:MAG TPA: hypothetical protein [Bacteriophage sp.]